MKYEISRSTFEAIFEDCVRNGGKMVIRNFDDYVNESGAMHCDYDKEFCVADLEEAYKFFTENPRCRVMNDKGYIYIDIFDVEEVQE